MWRSVRWTIRLLSTSNTALTQTSDDVSVRWIFSFFFFFFFSFRTNFCSPPSRLFLRDAMASGQGQDYYGVLGVAKDANENDLKKARQNALDSRCRSHCGVLADTLFAGIPQAGDEMAPGAWLRDAVSAPVAAAFRACPKKQPARLVTLLDVYGAALRAPVS